MALRDLEQVRAETHDVWHIAAIYDLAVRQSIAHAINVDGTRNVLDLCESLPSFERLMYIATCYVAGDRLLRQVGGAIGGLVRAEDLPARLGGDEFCVVLPDSTRPSSEPVLRRIAGVINFTHFAIQDVGKPVKIHLRSGCAELQADDSAESLIARSRLDGRGG